VIPVPKLKAIDGMAKKKLEPETEIEMEFIDGKLLSLWLDKFPLKKAIKICKQIGENIAKIHDLDIIHGDLTTSNMILKGDKIYFIDFGLSFHSARAEDKAVDLHLLREALEAKHFKHWQKYFEAAIEGYKLSKNSKAVLERLKKVESRGRYKGKGKIERL
ncbi:MAG: KEOPS complex kinase/ATPase Bud32, partial [Candidatus Pacearchaeota archaeon]|nr:KEOPS complex kinase/ATPase Bud32 [Candidatus Pacearchaeota archaeon]